MKWIRGDDVMFFKKEIYVTYDMAEYGRIVDALSRACIPYIFSTESPFTAGRSRGVPFVRQDAAVPYHVYVKRKDYKAAMDVLGLK